MSETPAFSPSSETPTTSASTETPPDVPVLDAGTTIIVTSIVLGLVLLLMCVVVGWSAKRAQLSDDKRKKDIIKKQLEVEEKVQGLIDEAQMIADAEFSHQPGFDQSFSGGPVNPMLPYMAPMAYPAQMSQVMPFTAVGPLPVMQASMSMLARNPAQLSMVPVTQMHGGGVVMSPGAWPTAQSSIRPHLPAGNSQSPQAKQSQLQSSQQQIINKPQSYPSMSENRRRSLKTEKPDTQGEYQYEYYYAPNTDNEQEEPKQTSTVQPLAQPVRFVAPKSTVSKFPGLTPIEQGNYQDYNYMNYM